MVCVLLDISSDPNKDTDPYHALERHNGPNAVVLFKVDDQMGTWYSDAKMSNMKFSRCTVVEKGELVFWHLRRYRICCGFVVTRSNAASKHALKLVVIEARHDSGYGHCT